VSEEVVELRGHLIESLILPRVLDIILGNGGSYDIEQIRVGVHARDVSFARILIEHENARTLETILALVERHGAEPIERREIRLSPAPRDGVLPEDFYSTTNLATSIFLRGRWIAVRNPEMDSAIVVDRSKKRASTCKMAKVRKGDLVVTGRQGVRVVQVETRCAPAEFGFMSSEVSSEKPKGLLIRAAGRFMKEERRAKRPILWVCGPALVHTGAGPLFERLIAAGYVQVLFAGNALATHDIENALMGTSLGVSMQRGSAVPAGHKNHLRAINTIRRTGGIRRAVGRRILRSGIMHACVRHKVDVVIAGSIRDDGPLPEAITDMMEAQDAMRRRCRRPRLAIMMATQLHSIATGNMLPARTRVVCVDIHESAVTKLMDRGTFQTMGIVTDVQPFLHELLLELGLSNS
jgi:lysine-ketoglutarate reductase/saccharopine dehydrogenase-like protein (TIGR00300 family)